jgi:hypothetical protein
MTAEQIVDEVAAQMGVSQRQMNEAKMWATLTGTCHKNHPSKHELSERDAHVVRMYFRTLLHKIATDPEYRAGLAREVKRRIERN